VERCLLAVGAVPVFALNGVPYFDSADVDRGLLHMCAESKHLGAAASEMIYGPPTGPVEFIDDADDDDDQADDPPPVPSNRLAKLLEGANRG